MRRDCFVTLVLTVMLGLAACTPRPFYRMTDVSGSQASAAPLKPEQGILVSVPDDAVYQHRPYPGSGQEVAKITAAAFARYAPHVDVAPIASQDRQGLLLAARNAGAGYLIIPSIVHWEQRATELSAIPSQVDIGLAVVDVATGREIRATVLEGRGNLRRMAQLDVEAMYSAALDQHVAELYGVKVPAGQK